MRAEIFESQFEKHFLLLGTRPGKPLIAKEGYGTKGVSNPGEGAQRVHCKEKTRGRPGKD